MLTVRSVALWCWSAGWCPWSPPAHLRSVSGMVSLGTKSVWLSPTSSMIWSDDGVLRDRLPVPAHLAHGLVLIIRASRDTSGESPKLPYTQVCTGIFAANPQRQLAPSRSGAQASCQLITHAIGSLPVPNMEKNENENRNFATKKSKTNY